MKKIIFAAAIAPMAILASCSSDDLTQEIAPLPTQDEQNASEAPVVTPLAVYLTDESGNRVDDFSSDFSTYNLHIEGAEAWIIESNERFVAVTEHQGTGDAVVPVYVATCWANSREAVLSVKTLDLDAATRADGEEVSTTQIGIRQAPAYTQTQLNYYNSNMGCGYAVDPNRSSELLMAIGQNVFDLEGLQDDGLLVDADNYMQYEDFYLAESEKKLHDKLAIAGGLSFKFGTVSAQGSGSYGSVYDTDESSWHCMMSNRTVMWQREISYMDLAHSDNPHYSIGFTRLSQNLEKELGKATNVDGVKKALNNFFYHFGPFFVFRSQLGVELAYTGSVHKSAVSDTTTVKAAIKVKWEKKVVKKEDKKDDKKDDDSTSKAREREAIDDFFAANASAAAADDKNSVEGEGSGEISKATVELSEKITATLDIKGGTNQISILGSGGIISTDQLTAWQRNITPKNAVMVKYSVAPIYVLFNETTQPKAYKYLKQFSEEGDIVNF